MLKLETCAIAHCASPLRASGLSVLRFNRRLKETTLVSIPTRKWCVPRCDKNRQKDFMEYIYLTPSVWRFGTRFYRRSAVFTNLMLVRSIVENPSPASEAWKFGEEVLAQVLPLSSDKCLK
ncbi:hypothetical protein AVEN_39953-1 [Araneus ventricosus]|uniref:Uncharacterized protein n=1 Tax=Araneus ventricosus TaxID=182803 RepID=A0A4Y2PB10_ARAVE|nr:hypothetical protein AVEN_55149-1 [Araneus ventricosus]GBN58041.1 hypothetical protein AVEN_39953-1 [Araneus ventricosus]